MYTHIEDNIYTIPVPLPNNPLRQLNSYVIKGEGRSLVIDTGFKLEECRKALCDGLEELGVDMNCTDIFLTHLHSDHSGLAAELATQSSKIYISRADGELLTLSLTQGLGRVEEYRSYGFSEKELENFWENPSMKYRQELPFSFTYVADGDVLTYGGRRLEVIFTPGHTPGHVCLYDRANKVMFLGDHVLFNITPNITTWPFFEDPLGHYVHSLMDISIYDVRLPLPAHRGVNGTMAERIGTIIEHHGARIREMLDILTERPGLTPYDLSGMMTWRVHGKTNSWADFPLNQKWFAVGETAAHLDYLLKRGRVRREFDGRCWHYSVD
ncbi:MAG TPA: MBL fold metallo-hydrolase [Candidatus Scatomorpha gallistercoris]|nr:MBL fold metallo-hydrolase [Candidatus Scatomorpha gallistercoris]